jgi:hypothetical protein
MSLPGSRLKNGVASLAYAPAIHLKTFQKKDGCAGHARA